MPSLPRSASDPNCNLPALVEPSGRSDFPLHRRQYRYLLAGYIVAAVLAAAAGALSAVANPAATKAGGALLYAVASCVCLVCGAWVAGDFSHRVNRRVGWNDTELGPPMSRARFNFLAGCAIYLVALMAVSILSFVVFVLGPLLLFHA